MSFGRFLRHGLWFVEYHLGHFPVGRVTYFRNHFSHYLRPSSSCSFSSASEAKEDGDKERITVTFVDKDGTERVVKVPLGMSMLEAAHENDVELEGACEGSLACSTCHVIVMVLVTISCPWHSLLQVSASLNAWFDWVLLFSKDVNYYNKLEDPTDEENDMLDLAFGLTETSRLGCQIIATPELDGLRLALPSATRNFAVDGHVPKPH